MIVQHLISSSFQNTTIARAHHSINKYSSLYSKIWNRVTPPINNGELDSDESNAESSSAKSSQIGTDPDEFAKAVVGQVLKPKMAPIIMEGKYVWVVLFLLMLPELVIEWLLIWRYNLQTYQSDTKKMK